MIRRIKFCLKAKFKRKSVRPNQNIVAIVHHSEIQRYYEQANISLQLFSDVFEHSGNVKMDSLYQLSSKMLNSTKVIILVQKKRKEVVLLGFELTTSKLEVESANHYTMDPSLWIPIFLKVIR